MDIAVVDKKEKEIVASKDATRYKKRFLKRQWEDARSNDGQSEEKRKKGERMKRKKVAMLMGYCGADYCGMQR